MHQNILEADFLENIFDVKDLGVVVDTRLNRSQQVPLCQRWLMVPWLALCKVLPIDANLLLRLQQGYPIQFWAQYQRPRHTVEKLMKEQKDD